MATFFMDINWWYLVLSLVGIIVIVQALRILRQARLSEYWPGVQGRIIESRIEKGTSLEIDGPDRTTQTPVVRYSYAIAGREFTADRVAFGPKKTNREPAAEVVSRYPVDKVVIVYYNPEHPEQAGLERVSASVWLQIVIGSLLFFAGIYLAIQ